MPKTLDWQEIAEDIPEKEAIKLLETNKTTKITSSQKTSCTLCLREGGHTMIYKLLSCNSSTCRNLDSTLACPWRGKVVTCSRTKLTTIMECYTHISNISSPRKTSLTAEHKELCRELTAKGMKPIRIRNELCRKFQLSNEQQPTLKQVQNFVNFFTRSKLGYNDLYDPIDEYIKANSYAGNEAVDKAFMFTGQQDAEGSPYVGDGSDEEPFLVGISTKTLLQRLNRPTDTFILHLDATLTLNQVGYPILVVGLSDRSHYFHLVALFVISQRTEQVYREALLSLRKIYAEVTKKKLCIKYVLSDAEDAQYHALEAVFRSDNDFIYIMCFYHVIFNVQKRLKRLPDNITSDIVQKIYEMHFSTNLTEFLTIRDNAIYTWRQDSSTASFADYFVRVWLNGRFSKWQCFHTPIGFATTNNPIERFNNAIQREYILRCTMKMHDLLIQLCDCCINESSNDKIFCCTSVASSALSRRMENLAKEQLLIKNQDVCHVVPGLIQVISIAAPKVHVPQRHTTEEHLELATQMGTNYARMEILGQPATGWQVNIAQKFCPCRYWFKFGICIHVLFALQISNRVNSEGHRVLHNRRVKRKTSNQQ